MGSPWVFYIQKMVSGCGIRRHTQTQIPPEISRLRWAGGEGRRSVFWKSSLAPRVTLYSSHCLPSVSTSGLYS